MAEMTGTEDRPFSCAPETHYYFSVKFSLWRGMREVRKPSKNEKNQKCEELTRQQHLRLLQERRRRYGQAGTVRLNRKVTLEILL